MKYIQVVFIIGLALIIMVSCRSVKTIQTAIAKKDTTQVIPVVVAPNIGVSDSLKFIRKVMDTVHKNFIDFETFSAKIKVHFEGSNGKRNDFTANIAMKKDSILWINITGPFGVNAFRALITPDSVKLLDKLEKTVRLRSVSYLQDIIHIPMTFTDLQNLLIGNPVFLDSNNITSYTIGAKSVSLISIGTLFKHFLTINRDDYTLQHSKLDDVNANRARTADITYGDYQNSKSGIRFSTYRRITVSEKSKLDIELEYKQFDFNQPVSFPFSIPKNYDRL
jgi:hypothetical protein